VRKSQNGLAGENMLQFHCQLFDEHKRPYFIAYHNAVHDRVVLRCANETQFISCSQDSRFEVFNSYYRYSGSDRKIYLISGRVGASVWVRAYCTPRNYFAP
jgi:hypothetical protein